MNQTFAKNFEALAKRFPVLAERLQKAAPFDVQQTASKDGGICYVRKNEAGQWAALSNPQDPIQQAQLAVRNCEDRLGKGIAPAVVVGLNPGYTLEIVYKHFKENYYDNYIPRRIYVVIDSIECLFGWLTSEDRTEILNKEEIEFYWKDEVKRIVRIIKRDELRSHLFIPVSSLPEHIALNLIDPLAQFFLERQEDEKKLYEENCQYYKKISDKELDKIIEGKADRKPRLMIPSHASSTVVQYSVRDTAAMFEKEGWEVKVIHMRTDLSRWRANKEINEFKPDIYIQVNHLRTENVDFYPPHLMFVTWVQDTVSYINNSESARIWNEHVKSKKERRDLIIGYVGQVKEYGYQEDRLSECPMIVNQELFKARELTPEEKAKYECDICFASNRSKETSLIVKEDLAPKLEKYGFTEEILMSIHDHLWEYYRDEKTCVGYIQLEDKIIELPVVCSLIEKLINKDDHDFVIQRIYWELNDVIYRHIVLEWIDEMGDKKLHLYGRGWENHPKFSKYAKGVLEHGEELALAYQSAKHCLHLNSLEGEHQRLTEIIDANGRPLSRLSLLEDAYSRVSQSLDGLTNLSSPNIHSINTIFSCSVKLKKEFNSKQFHNMLNDALEKNINRTQILQNLYKLSFLNKETFKLKIKSSASINYLEKHESGFYKKILKFFLHSNKTTSIDILPPEITSFIFGILENNFDSYIPNYPQLECNLLCKLIQSQTPKERAIKFSALRNRLIYKDILPELLLFYVNLKIQTADITNLKPIIKHTYQCVPNAHDLYYKYSRNLRTNNIDWFLVAFKDLVAGRMTIKSASQLTCLVLDVENKKIVLEKILEYQDKLVIPCDCNLSDILPIASQLIQMKYILPEEGKFLTHCNDSLLRDAFILSSLENKLAISNIQAKRLKSSISKLYYKILSNSSFQDNKKVHPEVYHELKLIAHSLILRRKRQEAFRTFKYLIKNNIELNQSEAEFVISSSDCEKKGDEFELIKSIYKTNSELYDLFTFSSKHSPQKFFKNCEIYKLDLNYGRLSLKSVNKYLNLDFDEAIKGITEARSQIKKSNSTIFDLFSYTVITINDKYGQKHITGLFEPSILQFINLIALRVCTNDHISTNNLKKLNNLIISHTKSSEDYFNIIKKFIVYIDKLGFVNTRNLFLKFSATIPEFSKSISSLVPILGHIDTKTINEIYLTNMSLRDLAYENNKNQKNVNFYDLIKCTKNEIDISRSTLNAVNELLISTFNTDQYNGLLKYIIDHIDKIDFTKNTLSLSLIQISNQVISTLGQHQYNYFIEKINNRITQQHREILDLYNLSPKLSKDFSGFGHPALKYLQIVYGYIGPDFSLDASEVEFITKLAKDNFRLNQEDGVYEIFRFLYDRGSLSQDSISFYLTLEFDHSLKSYNQTFEKNKFLWRDENCFYRNLFAMSLRKQKINPMVQTPKTDQGKLILSLVFMNEKRVKDALIVINQIKNPSEVTHFWAGLVFYKNKLFNKAEYHFSFVDKNLLQSIQTSQIAKTVKIVDDFFLKFRSNPAELRLRNFFIDQVS